MLNLVLEATDDETDLVRVMQFALADSETPPDYTAGAHLDFDLGDLGTRAYSLITWPKAQNRLTIAVQREPDGQGGSAAMHALSVGDIIKASAPKNDFALDDGAGPALLLAGGIGITPLISMATSLGQKGRHFALHACARTKDRMAFGTKLIAAFGEAVTFHYDNVSPIDLSAVTASQSPDTHVYICGPAGFIEAARAAAAAAGISADQIHVELFGTPAPQDGDQPFEVEINSGEVITVAPDQTIIEALEAAGVDVMYDCQRGDCGICQTDVIDGTPDHRDVVLSDEERASGKVMQICVSRAQSARLRLDI